MTHHDQRMAALGGFRPRPARSQPSPCRQPARGRRRDGDQECARRLHAPQRRRQHLGHEVPPKTSPPRAPSDKGPLFEPARTARSIATRPSTTSPTRAGRCDGRTSQGGGRRRRRRSQARRERLFDAACCVLATTALILGHRVSRMVRSCADVRRGHRARQYRARSDRRRRSSGSAWPARWRGQGRSADQIWPFCRDAWDFRNHDCWSSCRTAISRRTLMRQCLFDAWHSVLLARALSTARESARIAEIAAKAAKEVAYHLDRSGGARRSRLGDGTEESAAVGCSEALDYALALCRRDAFADRRLRSGPMAERRFRARSGGPRSKRACSTPIVTHVFDRGRH